MPETVARLNGVIEEMKESKLRLQEFQEKSQEDTLELAKMQKELHLIKQHLAPIPVMFDTLIGYLERLTKIMEATITRETYKSEAKANTAL